MKTSGTEQPRNIFLLHPSDFLTDHQPHGDGLTAFGFISEMAQRGYHLHVAAREYSLRSALPPNVTLYKVAVWIRVPLFDRLEYMLRARALFKQLRRTKEIHLIHQMNPVFAGLSLALAGCGTPIVLGTIVPRWPNDPDSLAVRHPMAGKILQTIKNVVVRLQQKYATALLLTSPAAVNRLPRPEAVIHKVRYVPHGIDTDLFCPAPAATEAKPPTVLFLANLQSRKGIFVLLEAFQRVAMAVPNSRLCIVGSGPQESVVAKYVSTMSCRDRIELVGNVGRDRVADFLRDCSVYCLPSLGEPYGATLVEAMSCGMPVVATAAGGVPFLVPENGGRLVPPGDPHALADALIEVLKSPELQRSMGVVNRRHATANLSWKTAVDKLELAYRAAFSHSEMPLQSARETIVAQPCATRSRS
jgi:L-malate glycosyltransferase